MLKDSKPAALMFSTALYLPDIKENKWDEMRRALLDMCASLPLYKKYYFSVLSTSLNGREVVQGDKLYLHLEEYSGV